MASFQSPWNQQIIYLGLTHLIIITVKFRISTSHLMELIGHRLESSLHTQRYDWLALATFNNILAAYPFLLYSSWGTFLPWKKKVVHWTPNRPLLALVYHLSINLSFQCTTKCCTGSMETGVSGTTCIQDWCFVTNP